MNLVNVNQSKTSEKKYTVAVVTALFNSEFTKKLEAAAIEFLKKSNVRNIYQVNVAGAFEIPMATQWLLQKDNVDAVVALGAVIRGETSHYDYVCNAVERGCSELQLAYDKPVGFGVLTTDNEQQTEDRCGGKHGNKGAEAAQVVMEMLNLKSKIQEI